MRGGLRETWTMADLGTCGATERAPTRNSPPKVSTRPESTRQRHGPLERWCTSAPRPSTQIGDTTLLAARCTKGGWQTARHEEFVVDGKAPSDIPAFQPDWGNPAVRNDRGDDGNVSIIRSLVRAIVLPDHAFGVVWVTSLCSTPATFSRTADKRNPRSEAVRPRNTSRATRSLSIGQIPSRAKALTPSKRLTARMKKLKKSEQQIARRLNIAKDT